MARMPHPQSRLSPPPGSSIPALLSSAGAQSHAQTLSGLSLGFGAEQDQDRDGSARKDSTLAGSTRKRDDAPKRGYRACVHCRLRKAKCDLGDVNAPSEPPCSRCRREQRNCVFLPSKRRRKTGPDDDADDKSMTLEAAAAAADAAPPNHDWALPATTSATASTADHGSFEWPEALPTSVFRDDHSASSMFAYPDLPQRPKDFTHSTQPHAQIQSHINPQSQAQSQSLPSQNHDYTRQAPVDPPSIPQSTPGSLDSTSTSALSPSSRTKRRQGPDATRRIVVANFSNETDALEILARAATDEDKDRPGDDRGESKGGKRVAWKDEEKRGLGEYLLVRLGVLDEGTLWELVQTYFKHYHPVLPIFQTNRIPASPKALARVASEDPFLIACCVAVASRHHSDPRFRAIHERTWGIIREALSDYAFGGVEASVGLVEGVLLLAEFLPREKSSKGAGGSRDPSLELLAGRSDGGLHGTENRRTWALTGVAIRAAYGLGLDQLALEHDDDRSPEAERARLAFTWCYLYDRTIDKSTLSNSRLAFWSRGPAICFTGYSHVSQTGEAAARHNFPLMVSPEETEEDRRNGGGADSASLIQALMELTQIMTNAHDTLYPNRTRTNDLVRQGAYFRFLDSFRRALDSFKSVWEPKQWRDPILKELTWCTYEMVRLYVSSFAFQAHVQRAWMRAEEEAGTTGGAGAAGVMTPTSSGLGGATAPLLSMGGHAAGGVQLFPRGSATSPDALFIYASVDAAAEILSICLRLSKQGVLKYLPSRYLTNFVYAGVFSLKSAYSGAQGRGDLAKSRELVDRVCAALVLASPDREHPASRYGQMLRLLSKKLEELSEQSAVPSRFPSPEPQAAPMLPLQPSTNSAWENFIIPTDFPALGTALNTNDSLVPPQTGLEGIEGIDTIFDFDVDVNFNMDGFWDDFTLAEGSGFPFR